MQCNAMQCNAMQCNAMQCNAMQLQYNTIQQAAPVNVIRQTRAEACTPQALHALDHDAWKKPDFIVRQMEPLGASGQSRV